MSPKRRLPTLTVAELIVRLSQFPPAARVHLASDEEGNETRPLLAADLDTVQGKSAVVLFPKGRVS